MWLQIHENNMKREREKNYKGKNKKNYRMENKSESLSEIEDAESHE